MKKEKQEAGAYDPYLNGRREWNERYGDYIKATHHWKLAAMGAALISLMEGAALLTVINQQKVVPYAVEFNEHHEPVRVIRADVMASPNASQIRAALRTWIMGARAVYLDRRAMRDMLVSTYALTQPSSQAYGALTSFHKENDPYKVSQSHTVEVAVNTVLQSTEDTWRIEWTETRRQLSGRIIDSRVWQANVTVVIIPPTDESQILLNPIGMYVNSFDWSGRI